MRLKILRTALQASTCSFRSTGTSTHGSSKKTFAEFVRNTFKRGIYGQFTSVRSKKVKAYNEIPVLLPSNPSPSSEQASCFTYRFTFLHHSGEKAGAFLTPRRLALHSAGFVCVSPVWSSRSTVPSALLLEQPPMFPINEVQHDQSTVLARKKMNLLP